ncbi:hypothetical protein K504DRAFT_373647 [Pleomassaria siparia CBS 279.74]|uniref:Uncharacterized protein n=1 Tax=Pleomassaria siparia CBS 279.74 TaxID=1314801 RepID=A0A6G1KI54_9PLEO|nr:hypothetical protein K504DRAFT_373647 [Pleomassaria siparia CBS 279.74]
MASDQAYEDFLNKANDTGVETKDTERTSYKTKSVNKAVPKILESVEEYYTSDADEPFEVVSLSFTGDTVTAAKLKSLVGHAADFESISEKDFDPKGQYAKVLEAVKKAGNGKVKVFRVQLEGSRCEYWVVSVDIEEERLVGLKALSVES